MKTLPTIIAASILLASVSATAGMSFEQSLTKTLTTSTVPTKAAALQLGADKLNQLKNSSTVQLENTLDVPFGEIESNTLHLKDEGYVSIEERMDANGQLGYAAVVEVNVGFVPHDSDR